LLLGVARLDRLLAHWFKLESNKHSHLASLPAILRASSGGVHCAAAGVVMPASKDWLLCMMRRYQLVGWHSCWYFEHKSCITYGHDIFAVQQVLGR
jgi:hypothetical protein